MDRNLVIIDNKVEISTKTVKYGHKIGHSRSTYDEIIS